MPTSVTARLGRRAASVLAALATATAIAAPAADAADPVKPCPNPGDASVSELSDLASYRVHTIFRRADGTEIDRTINAVALVPTLVNVDSLALPDVSVTLSPTSDGGARLTIARLATAPAELPLLVEAQIDATPNVDVHFGYDAREGAAPGSLGNAPQSVTAEASFAFNQPQVDGTNGSTTDLDVDVTTAGADDALALIAEGKATDARDRKAAHVAFAPVPATLGVDVRLDCKGTTSTADVDLTSATQTVAKADVTVEDLDVAGAARTTAIDALVDKLPTSANVTVVEDPATRVQRVNYSSPQALGRAEASLEERGANGTTVKRRIEAKAAGVPAGDLRFLKRTTGEGDDELTRVAYESPGSVGSVDVLVFDPAALVTGKSGTRATVVKAHAEGLPKCAQVDLVDEGFTARTNRGVLSTTDCGTNGRLAKLEALATTGTAAAPLQPESDDVVPSTHDGLSLLDIPGRFTGFVRATDVQGAHFLSNESGTTDKRKTFDMGVQHGTASSRPLTVRLELGNEREYLDARAASQPRTVDLDVELRTLLQGALVCTPAQVGLEQCQQAFEVDYVASSAIAPAGGLNGLLLDTNMGDHDRPLPHEGFPVTGHPNLRLIVPTLPARVDACTATANLCGFPGSGRFVEDSELQIDASQQMAIDLFDCKRTGLDGTCTRGTVPKEDRQISTFVDIERITFAEMETTIPRIEGGDNGHIYLNTTRNGTTFQIDGDGRDLFTSSSSADPCERFSINQIDGFLDRIEADDRVVVFEITNPFLLGGCKPTGFAVKSRTGDMTCGDGFFLDTNPDAAFGRIDDDICTDRI